MLKKVLMHTRRTLKIVVLAIIALLIIALIIASFYKLGYGVYINNELVGYTYNKSEIQKKISNYLDGNEEENVAFVAINELPKYKLCLIKRNTESCDNKLFDEIKSDGMNYYRYYAISENQEEKYYVKTFSEAENIVNNLKEKNSSNIDAITISEKYETELKPMTDVDTVVSSLYVEPKPVEVATKKTSKTISTVSSSSKAVNTSRNMSSANTALGVSLIRPVQGIISSRFGERSSIRSGAHTGLDLAIAAGTPISAAASGTVSFAGWKGSYGWLIVINHTNGVQTYYGHCSKLYVSEGQSVTQGQVIGAVGSTGNSTGPHLHFEVRVNGIAYNPLNYV